MPNANITNVPMTTATAGTQTRVSKVSALSSKCRASSVWKVKRRLEFAQQMLHHFYNAKMSVNFEDNNQWTFVDIPISAALFWV